MNLLGTNRLSLTPDVLQRALDRICPLPVHVPHTDVTSHLETHDIPATALLASEAFLPTAPPHSYPSPSFHHQPCSKDFLVSRVCHAAPLGHSLPRTLT